MFVRSERSQLWSINLLGNHIIRKATGAKTPTGQTQAWPLAWSCAGDGGSSRGDIQAQSLVVGDGGLSCLWKTLSCSITRQTPLARRTASEAPALVRLEVPQQADEPKIDKHVSLQKSRSQSAAYVAALIADQQLLPLIGNEAQVRRRREGGTPEQTDSHDRKNTVIVPDKRTKPC